MTSILLIAIIIGMFYVLFLKRKTTAKAPIVTFSSRKHFAILTGYIVFLLVVLVTAEIVERLHEPLSMSSSSEYFTSDLIINESTNSPLFLEKRIHSVGNKLSIQNEHQGAYLYIERKQGNEGVVEEFIFKPSFFANKYNLSDSLHFAKPNWQDHLMIIPEQPISEIRFARFSDSVLLNQLTGFRGQMNSSFSSSSPIIHLIVPESIEIEVSPTSSIQYIEE